MWYVCRISFDQIEKEHCQLALVIKRPSEDESITHGFARNDKTSYLILTGEKVLITSSAWLYPLSVFPLEDEQ